MSKDYTNLSNDEVEIIVKDGLKSEFWKWYTANYEEGQKTILDQVISLRLQGWDDLVKIVNLLASYKSREESFNFPMSILKMMEIEKQNNKLGLTPKDRSK